MNILTQPLRQCYKESSSPSSLTQNKLERLSIANLFGYFIEMEQHTSKNVNNSMTTNIYSYLETSGGQSSYQYLNYVHFSNNCVN
jgi:hypothetical protein